MSNAAQKATRVRLEKNADSGPSGPRYNLFDSVPEIDRKGQHGGIFDSPEPPTPPTRGQHGGIFDSPGAPRAPTPRAPVPRAEPAAPTPPPASPEPPVAPQPAPAPAPPPAQAAPPAAAPGRPEGPNLKGLKRNRQFKQFLQEKHQRGEGKVPHPKPQLRRRYRDGIKFWTAMKYQEFHAGLMREFDAWKQEQAGGDAGAGRDAPAQQEGGGRQVGQKVGDIGQLKQDDIIQRGNGAKWKVQENPGPDRVVMQKVNDEGVVSGQPFFHDPEYLGEYKFVKLAPETPPAPPPSRGTITIPVEEGWRERDAALQKLAREGTKVGRDAELGEEGANGAVKRRMKLPDGSEHDFVFKATSKERPNLRLGTPNLAAREGAFYEIDRLLGDGAVTPASVAVQGPGGGSYQAFVPGTQSFYGSGFEPAGAQLEHITTKDLIRHPQVQRLTVLDALLGHEDRHPGNVMFSWADPDGPKTAENIRFTGIDNGYAMAESHDKFQPGEVVAVRDPWVVSTNWRDPGKLKERWDIQKKILSKIPETLHEQLKQLKPKDVAETMVKSGIRDASAIRATLVRLAVLQDNPEALKSFMARRRDDDPRGGPRATSSAVKGQKDWQRMSHTKPEKLLRDHTDLPTSTFADIRTTARQAIDANSSRRR